MSCFSLRPSFTTTSCCTSSLFFFFFCHTHVSKGTSPNPEPLIADTPCLPLFLPVFLQDFSLPASQTHTFLLLCGGAAARNVSNSTVTNCSGAAMVAIMPACPHVFVLTVTVWSPTGRSVSRCTRALWIWREDRFVLL